MKSLAHFVTALALLAGMGLFLLAAATPSTYHLAGASAPQISQVYAEASHYALLSCAAFLFGILIEVSIVAGRK